MPAITRSLAVALAAFVAVAGCAAPDASAPSAAPCTSAGVPTVEPGTLTVATGEPFAPWYVGDPESGEGFESALVYAVADRLGFAPEDVRWQVATFAQIVAPGIKKFDIAAYQASISAERRTAVDFSAPYLQTRQSILVRQDSTLAQATRIAEFSGARIGVTATQTSLGVATAAFGPGADIVPFSGAGDGMAALESGLVEAMVMDVDQAVTAAEQYFPGTTVVGTLPSNGEPEEYGFVLDLGSEATSCVSAALDALRADGTLAELRATWLRSDDVPELS